MDQISEAISLLEQKKALMTDLFNWTRAQTALIEHENLEFLDKNIEFKQSIIDRIDLIDEKYSEIDSQYKISKLPEEFANKISRLKGEIKDIIAETMKIDAVNRDLSDKLLIRYRHDMENSTKAHNVMRAYSKSNVNDQMYTGNFINKQS